MQSIYKKIIDYQENIAAGYIGVIVNVNNFRDLRSRQ